MDEREKAARLDLLKFQVGELEKARSACRRRRRARNRPGACLSSADKLQRLCERSLRGALRQRRGGAGAAWRRLEARRRARRGRSRLPTASRGARRDQVAARRSRADPARVRRDDRRVARAPAGSRGPAGAPRAAQAQIRSVARGRHREAGRAVATARRAAERRRAPRGARGRDARRAGKHFWRARERCRARGARRRRSSAPRFKRSSAELAMGRTQFDVRFDAEPPEAAWTENGVDVARVLSVGQRRRRSPAAGAHRRRAASCRASCSPSGRWPRPLRPGKTLIFDEIDAGIGGRVADVVGRKLRRIGESFQVLCITHLPQIAAAGHVHFHISKSGRQRPHADARGSARRDANASRSWRV